MVSPAASAKEAAESATTRELRRYIILKTICVKNTISQGNGSGKNGKNRSLKDRFLVKKGESMKKSSGFVQNPMNLFGLEFSQCGFLKLADPFLGEAHHRGYFLEVQVRIHSESEIKS